MVEEDRENIRLIVGLGNPGPKYAGTRHNLGFRVVNELSRRWDIPVDKRKFKGRFALGRVSDLPVALLKPSTYMNESGLAVEAAVNFYRLSPSDILVVLDDMALPVGQLRLRLRGSGGTHKGLIDILNRMGTQALPRLRVGIGAPPPLVDGVEFVLSRFLPEEEDPVREAISQAADAIDLAIRQGYDRAMERYNRPNDGRYE